MLVVQLRILHWQQFLLQGIISQGESCVEAIPVAVRREPWYAYNYIGKASQRLAKSVQGKPFPCLGEFPDGTWKAGEGPRWWESWKGLPLLAAYVEGASGTRLYEYWMFEVEDTE
jgi:hypothetical protein